MFVTYEMIPFHGPFHFLFLKHEAMFDPYFNMRWS